MREISVVIVCKNEEAEIGRCLASVKELTDDIVVLDNGSTDRTKDIVVSAGARLIEESWEGFGKTKNKATQLAKYEWILNLDADESIDRELNASLLSLTLDDPKQVFRIRFKNFFGKTHLKFGEWGWDEHIRLFNRSQAGWDQATVHEGLVLPEGSTVKRLRGYILHYTVRTVAEYAEKMSKYALLSADKYASKGKRSSWVRILLSPAFTFIKYYIFKLGFLDGREGFICARMSSYYTFIKYARLLELQKANHKP